LKKTQLWVQLSAEADGIANASANGALRARWGLVQNATPGTSLTLQDGSVAQLASWLQEQQLPDASGLHTVLLMAGDSLVTRQLTFLPKEKRHLQRLLPFMLEPELAADISQVHVASAEPRIVAESGYVSVAYADKKPLQSAIHTLEDLGLEVEEVYALPAMLPTAEQQWSILLDGDICHLHCGHSLCASVEPALVLPLLETVLAADTQVYSGTRLTVLVSAAEHTTAASQTVFQSLAQDSSLAQAGIKVDQHVIAQVWSGLRCQGEQLVNLRQGELAAPLRTAKYWKTLRTPVIAAMLAVCAVITSVFVETTINQRRFAVLQTQIEQRYRDVMPEGVLVDAVQQLSTQLARYRAGESSVGPVAMLNAMLDAFEITGELNLHRLSFNSNDQNNPEIQMTISAPTTAVILELSETLSASGWTAQAQNISRAGDLQQANLIVRGNGL
jgi:type II secretion system protein L